VTGAYLTPHWTVADQWTGVVLMLVPTPDLPVPPQELAAAVTAAVRSDVIAFDLVTVGLAPAVDGSPERDDVAAAALLPAAAPAGHLVAPRVVFACVVVGAASAPIDRAAERLSRHARLQRLHTSVHRQVVTGPDQGVAAMGPLVAQLISAAERRPETAVDEASYLSELARDEVSAVAPAPDRPRVEDARRRDDPRQVSARPGEPVLTEPYWLDHLAATAGAAALVQLILVPDYERPPRGIADRRRAVALALDDVLGRAYRHPTGRDLNVALEVQVATSPLTRGTPLRPAGVLAGDELPAVPVEYFDIYDVADELVGAQTRAMRALGRRQIEVTSVHLIVLTTTAPLYHDEAAELFDELVRRARVSWLQFGPGELLPDEFTRHGADQVLRYRDHADVVSELMTDAEDLYGVPIPPFMDDAIDDGIDNDERSPAR
jgi:hypothetical protein